MMKFETLKPADAGLAGNGTHLEGHVSAYYHQLVEAFGEPTYDSGGDKTTVEWIIEFDDGEVATIYDWKCYETPFGEYNWHIGGFNNSVVERIQFIVSQKQTKVA
jgi:hypothetical protein